MNNVLHSVPRRLNLSGKTGDPAQPAAANRGISRLPATMKLKIKSKRRVRRKPGTQNYTRSSRTASIFPTGNLANRKYDPKTTTT